MGTGAQWHIITSGSWLHLIWPAIKYTIMSLDWFSNNQEISKYNRKFCEFDLIMHELKHYIHKHTHTDTQYHHHQINQQQQQKLAS